MNKILVFGEILWDVFPDQKFIGGAPFNFAAHLHKLGQQVMFLSALGTDMLGEKAVEKVKKIGLDDSMLQKVENKPTGKVIVNFTGEEANYEILKDVAYDYIDYPNNQFFETNDFNVLYFGTLIQRNEKSRDTLLRILENNSFQKVFYDMNLREGNYKSSHIKRSLKFTTILKLNKDEWNKLQSILGYDSNNGAGFQNFLLEQYKNLELIVLTDGAKGVTIYRRDLKPMHFEARKVKVADTVGAGDSFSAAFTAGILQGLNLKSAAEIAVELAGFVASSRGAIPDYPLVLIEKIKSVFH